MLESCHSLIQLTGGCLTLPKCGERKRDCRQSLQTPALDDRHGLLCRPTAAVVVPELSLCEGEGGQSEDSHQGWRGLAVRGLRKYGQCGIQVADYVVGVAEGCVR